MKIQCAKRLFLGLSLIVFASFGVHADDAWRGLPMASPESVGMSKERLDRVGEAMSNQGAQCPHGDAQQSTRGGNGVPQRGELLLDGVLVEPQLDEAEDAG